MAITHVLNGRGWRTLVWAVATALAVAASLAASGRTINAGLFYWSLQARIPVLERRMDAHEQASTEKLDRILTLLEEQKREREREQRQGRK